MQIVTNRTVSNIELFIVSQRSCRGGEPTAAYMVVVRLIWLPVNAGCSFVFCLETQKYLESYTFVLRNARNEDGKKKKKGRKSRKLHEMA